MLANLNTIKNKMPFSGYSQKDYSDSSTKPAVDMKVAIVDTFTRKTRDINGDGCPDLAHGEVVEAVARGNLKYSPQIVRFDDESDGGAPEEKKLLEIFKKIESDKSIKAVNLSIACTSTFSNLNDAYNAEFKTSGDNIDKETILAKRKDVIKLFGGAQEKVFKGLLNELKKIAKNRPVFVAAGNSTSSELNLFSLADGTIGVGCMSVNGKPKVIGSKDKYTQKSFFSGDNSTVSVFSKGVYDINPVKKDGNVIGYDITEDGKMDIPISKITGYDVIKRFVGKDIADLAACDQDYEKVKQLQREENWGVESDLTDKDKEKLSEKLYSLDKLLDYGIVDCKTITRNLTKGNYANLESVLKMEENLARVDFEDEIDSPTVLLKVNEDNKVVYNPHVEIDGDDSAGKIQGTSYSTPTALAHYLNSMLEKGSKK